MLGRASSDEAQFSTGGEMADRTAAGAGDEPQGGQKHSAASQQACQAYGQESRRGNAFESKLGLASGI